MADPIVDSTEARLLQALRALGSPERAEHEKRYQKSRWEHWGVPLPSMDVAIKETLGDLSQEQSLDLCRRLWREPVWDRKTVAGRILARKSIQPDGEVWGFVTERLIDLDGWAVAGGDAAGLAKSLSRASSSLARLDDASISASLPATPAAFWGTETTYSVDFDNRKYNGRL
jgi:hypothetical protein